MPLDVEISDHGAEGRRVTLTGRLDSETAPLLEACLAPALAVSAVTALVFDLAALEYISSAGIRTVAKARKVLEGRGGRVTVAHLQPAVSKVFDIVRALPATDIFTSEAELDAYLDAMQRRVRRGPSRGGRIRVSTDHRARPGGAAPDRRPSGGGSPKGGRVPWTARAAPKTPPRISLACDARARYSSPPEPAGCAGTSGSSSGPPGGDGWPPPSNIGIREGIIDA